MAAFETAYRIWYNQPVRIAIGSDHAGYSLKEDLKGRLAPIVDRIDDVGTDSEASVDYPDFAAAVGALVASGRCDRGILVCGTGIGMSLAANKVHGIRAAAVGEIESARLCREHNDANVLCLGARLTPPDIAYSFVRTFLETPFAGGRHQRRVDKIMALETLQPGPKPSGDPDA
jgi:ribose 5-phosphate isomerase B